MGQLLSKVSKNKDENEAISTSVAGSTITTTLIHKVLSQEYIKNKRIFVIGDVHGCYDELELLLNKVNAFTDDILVLFVGDMLNKGPKSIEVLKLLRKHSNFHSIIGNHEEKIIDKLNDIPYKALSPKFRWIQQLDEHDIAYLKALPYTISIPDYNSIVVHAGFVPGVPLELQKLFDMTHMRNIVEGSDSKVYATEKKKIGVAWASTWTGPQHVFFGHDASRRLQLGELYTGLDTGCLYGGELTGQFITGDRKIVSVPSFKEYVEKNPKTLE